ncbi:unnamed protein product, partial [Rhizoctonia solani]
MFSSTNNTNPKFPSSPPLIWPNSPVEALVGSFDPASPVLLPSHSALLPFNKVTGYIDDALLALGLHTEARTSFITYWLPDLSKHAFIALRFLTQNEYERAAPLDVSPAPQVVTRVFMLFRGVQESQIELWNDAAEMASRDVTVWRDIVGVDISQVRDKSLFRVLEWGVVKRPSSLDRHHDTTLITDAMDKLAALIFLVVGAHAAISSNSSLPAYPSDPYLQYQPSFAYSLPIQILVTGIVFTLVLVLFIHLLFTAQYHWPLARLNYILQLCGVVTLLIWLSATLIVVLKYAHQRSRGWPYMLDYVGVDIPSDSWTDTQEAWWSLIVLQITHIQFLTLLYPSGIEARLIFLLLGPLAIASSGMVFTSMNSAAEVRDLGDAVRNVCNSALSLLFTAALLAWGFVIHRTPAWRTDGGTAAFGIGAIILAVLSTVSNFLQIFLNRRIHWLLSLTWAIVLWQSFLGWWWWVGSGEGINEVEDMLDRERRRRRKRAKKRRKEARATTASGADAQRGILRTFRRRGSQAPDDNEGSTPRRAGTMSSVQDNASSHPDGSSHPENTLSNPETHSHSTSSNTSTAPSNAFGRAWASIRHAHRRATTVQAIEQVELRNATPGWGL